MKTKNLRKMSLAVLVLAAGSTQAAVILGTGHIAGTNNVFSESFSVDATFTDSTSPVTIVESATYKGVGETGTVLGRTEVFGDDSGFFNLSVFGQGNHDNFSQFQYQETIENLTATDLNFSLSFLISAGEIQARALEGVPQSGEFQEAGYEITISFGGAVLFSSNAAVRQSNNTTSFTQGGTDLLGVLNETSSTITYSWSDFAASLDLGILAAGTSSLLAYDVRTYVMAQDFSSCGSSNCGMTRSRIGDPFDVENDLLENESSIGLAGISSGPAPTQVPEPAPLGLLLVGMFILLVCRRYRWQADA